MTFDHAQFISSAVRGFVNEYDEFVDEPISYE